MHKFDRAGVALSRLLIPLKTDCREASFTVHLRDPHNFYWVPSDTRPFFSVTLPTQIFVLLK